ncbi:MAG: 6-pyruvoyl-tetrahydropterin synthase related domain [Rhodobacteraceae bacterium HLUCCA12]|nr:MAG: 6-pyruvoyl-tetrahydropterin synthase related domain [Rhodobacteraceae bacterium HLUCCA12]
MILELIAALASGFALFGVLLLINRVSGRWMPRWVFPAAVGLGMLSYSIWSEYSWAGRAIAPGSPYVEVSRNHNSSWYRPWTYLWPQVNRMIALDRRFTRTHPDQPQLVLTRVVRLERWIPESGYLAVFDCEAEAQAALVEGVELEDDGTLDGADWVPMGEDDPVLRGACAQREG